MPAKRIINPILHLFDFRYSSNEGEIVVREINVCVEGHSLNFAGVA